MSFKAEQNIRSSQTTSWQWGLWIDDENEKNANQAIVWDKWNNPIGYDLPADKNFHGITPGRNTIYEILQF